MSPTDVDVQIPIYTCPAYSLSEWYFIVRSTRLTQEMRGGVISNYETCLETNITSFMYLAFDYIGRIMTSNHCKTMSLYLKRYWLAEDPANIVST